MSLTNAEEVLRALLASKSPSEVRDVLQEVGDSADIGLDTPCPPFEFCWHAFGDSPSNISSIGLASKAGRSLTERLTNAVDAVLEHRVQEGIAPPNSPRLAAQQWFGRPASGPDEGAFRWDHSTHKIDRRTAVILHESQIASAPTVDVFDDGIGIRPEEFGRTILSPHAGSKIKKRFLIGAFGQGGASTLAFCDYAIIVSRHADNPRVVGFTVIRVVKLDETWKEDCIGCP